MHFLTLVDFSEIEIMQLIKLALDFKKQSSSKIIEKKSDRIFNLFIEPSTRTFNSFKLAESNCGIESFDFNIENSSLNKQESFRDTILSLKAMGIENFVIRHPETNYYHELLDIENINIINAGDGIGHHPSQTLLDLITIYEEFKKFHGLKILIIGDLDHSRVFHSNAEIMTRLGMEILLYGPEWLSANIRKTSDYKWVKNIDNLKNYDVIYLLRIQHERHDRIGKKMQEFLTENLTHDFPWNHHYGINKTRLGTMHSKAIFMHPGPVNRNTEILSELVEHKQSRIWQQVNNGVYARMAILKFCLGSKD